MGCRHRTGEICNYTNKQCLGARYDEVKWKYTIDPWQERACPNYEEEIGEGGEVDAEKSSTTPWNLKEGDEYKVCIRIFGKDKERFCDEEGCTIGRSIKEDAEVLEALLNRRYEGGIKVEGIEVKSQRMEEFPEIRDFMGKKGLNLVVTIDNEIKFVEEIPLDLIKAEIEKRGIERRAMS